MGELPAVLSLVVGDGLMPGAFAFLDAKIFVQAVVRVASAVILGWGGAGAHELRHAQALVQRRHAAVDP